MEQPTDSDESEGTPRDGWKAEIVAEFEKGGPRVGMVDVSRLISSPQKSSSKLNDGSGTQQVRH